jgi:hypothetical protein
MESLGAMVERPRHRFQRRGALLFVPDGARTLSVVTRLDTYARINAKVNFLLGMRNPGSCTSLSLQFAVLVPTRTSCVFVEFLIGYDREGTDPQHNRDA